MTTFNPNLHAVPGDDESLPLDSAAVVAEMEAAQSDKELIREWLGRSGWQSFHGYDHDAADCLDGSDAQLEALNNFRTERFEAFKADQANWIAARERVIKRGQDDAAEHAADARLAA